MTSLAARTVHLIVSAATLLSGSLDECLTHLDPSCVGGVATVDALARNLTENDPFLVLPFFDKSSPFVQMHPLGWTVNRLVLQHIMGWPVLLSTPALLTQNKEDFDVSSRDLSDLQSTEFPFLLSNVAVPPSNSWSAYTLPVYLDEATGLAVMSMVNDKQSFNVDQVEATIGILNYVERLNQREQCYEEFIPSLLDQYINRTITERRCWIPVVVYRDTKDNFLDWLPLVMNHTNPPALIVNVEEQLDEFVEPKQISGVWIVSYEVQDDVYVQLPIEIAQGGRTISNVGYIEQEMDVISSDLKDTTYLDYLATLRQLADEAASNDPIVGLSVAIPPQRDGTYRRCKAGECEIGNLFNDAARWYTKSDVAFQPSGGFRGDGWDAGNVTVSDIWGALPFDNTLCTGVLSGVSLFQLFNYSVSYSTFEGENTQLGDRLLQVSGLRISYNLQLANTTRLVKIEVYDDVSGDYKEIDRLGLYSFVTDSYTCGGFEDFPFLLGEESLTQPGEDPGAIGDGIILQTVVGDFLSQLDEQYDPSRLGNRLVNRTDLFDPLNFVQTEDSCLPGEYWQEDLSSCAKCPNETTVAFLSEELEFDVDGPAAKMIKLVNAALYDVAVFVKSMPTWVSVASVIFENSNRTVVFDETTSVTVPSGANIIIYFDVDIDALEPGTAQGSVAFGVVDGGQYPGCEGRDASFEIFARKYPPEDLNQLGPLRSVGWAMAGIVCLLALFLSGWVLKFQKLQMVRILQPTFLVAISTGVFFMGLALIPMGVDDEIASERLCDISCMSIPWLLSLGFTIAMSALFSKLWRIQRLFKATTYGRRVNVGVKNVVGPFVVMLTLNFGVLLAWTVVSPLQWQRQYVEGEPWNSYGVCQSENERFGRAMTITVCVINTVCLFLASIMAYNVRDVSDEFSESKRMGLALLCWVQLLLVTAPMLVLIDSDNPAARYFLEIGVVFAVCVSMLCFIFVPIMWQKKQAAIQLRRSAEARSGASQGNSVRRTSKKFTLKDKGTRVSGLDFAGQDFVHNNSERCGTAPKEHPLQLESIDEDNELKTDSE